MSKAKGAKSPTTRAKKTDDGAIWAEVTRLREAVSIIVSALGAQHLDEVAQRRLAELVSTPPPPPPEEV